MIVSFKFGAAGSANKRRITVLCPPGFDPPRFVDLDQRRSVRLAGRARPSRLAHILNTS
jgi:hypothetical protein